MSSVAQQWSEKLSAWRDSGLSAAAWCRESAENYHRFLYWRKRLSPEQQRIGKFVEVQLATPPIALSCNGVHIHVSSGFDAGLLGEIIAALKRL